jgi:hypothetical protein
MDLHLPGSVRADARAAEVQIGVSPGKLVDAVVHVSLAGADENFLVEGVKFTFQSDLLYCSDQGTVIHLPIGPRDSREPLGSQRGGLSVEAKPKVLKKVQIYPNNFQMR